MIERFNIYTHVHRSLQKTVARSFGEASSLRQC